jgi:phosphatidylserine/phosphatidylglycerophosphate/cardiolipin synthase-like enzyme
LTNVAEEKHIRVGIITRPAKSKRDIHHQETVRLLHKRGFQIVIEDNMHAKLFLIDDNELLIGSANLIGTSLNRNYESALWTNNHKTVQDAKLYFTDLMDAIFTK